MNDRTFVSLARMVLKRTILSLAAMLFPVVVLADNWPQFRGPGSQGISRETNLPVKWDGSTGVRWKTRLPGPGHSSPVIWGNRIFLTAYNEEKKQLLALALDKATGKVVWERAVEASRIEQYHPTNAPASPTPVTDGKLLFVYFGSSGLTAFDFDGKKVWENRFGPFPNEWGSASSPILYNDMLILNVDTDGEDFLLAVNKGTGRTLWKTSRSDVNRSWPTPVIWNGAGRDEIVVSGSGRVKSYDPKDGSELWSVDGLTRWVTPTPVMGHGMIFVASNGPGGNVIMAIKPGGRGNITTSHVAWRYDKSAPYSSSPVIVGDYLYSVKNGGVMTCLNAKTGEVAWQERLPARGAFYASLLAADGKIYALSEDGEAAVIAAKPTYELLSFNKLNDRTMATPSISDGRLFIRSDDYLYCIGK